MQRSQLTGAIGGSDYGGGSVHKLDDISHDASTMSSLHFKQRLDAIGYSDDGGVGEGEHERRAVWSI